MSESISPRHLEHCVREAATTLSEALSQQLPLRRAGQSDRFRARLAQAIALAETGLARVSEPDTELVWGAERDRELEWAREARWILLRAQATRAEDARYGAGQLARGAQRAPTGEDCEDGWQRVAEIVADCQAAADEAVRLAARLKQARAHRLALGAVEAARVAQALLVERNQAYTFHANPKFSFGEGWYVTAAATLGAIHIQIEPDQPQTPAVEHFVHQAGLAGCVVPYRARPRANKALPDLIARGFRADPRAAQQRLRWAFLGDEPVAPAIVEFAARALGEAPPGKKVLLWVRYGQHHPQRNTVHAELLALVHALLARGFSPILVGDALRGDGVPDQACDLTLFWKQPLFQGLDQRRAQLQLFEALRSYHGVVGQIGVTTAGMDGPALMGLPTAYLTEQPNVRLGKWVGAVPDYHEVVRDGAVHERIAALVERW